MYSAFPIAPCCKCGALLKDGCESFRDVSWLDPPAGLDDLGALCLHRPPVGMAPAQWGSKWRFVFLQGRQLGHTGYIEHVEHLSGPEHFVVGWPPSGQHRTSAGRIAGARPPGDPSWPDLLARTANRAPARLAHLLAKPRRFRFAHAPAMATACRFASRRHRLALA